MEAILIPCLVFRNHGSVGVVVYYPKELTEKHFHQLKRGKKLLTIFRSAAFGAVSRVHRQTENDCRGCLPRDVQRAENEPNVQWSWRQTIN